jgi:hypothetical protein
MDKPKVEISLRKSYNDRFFVGAEILYPGDLRIVFNSEYFLETGKCDCKIISLENGGKLTQARFDCTDRKCKVYENGCDLFTDEFLEEIRTEAAIDMNNAKH